MSAWTPDPRAREWEAYRAERRTLAAAGRVDPFMAAWHSRHGREVGDVEPDETVYVRPATAAAITGMHTSRLAVLRRRGRLRSIGMTPGEYKRARALAGWRDAAGWGPGVWYLREDVERLAAERWAA